MNARFFVIEQRLVQEWASVQIAAQKASDAFASDNDLRVDAAALNLHAFYSGLERIFELIARQIDDSVPTGSTWHQDLLRQMTLDVSPVRPAVLEAATAGQLRDFLGFRHVVRNLYAWELEEPKVAHLVGQLPDLVTKVDGELSRFLDFLLTAGDADEEGA